MDDRTWTRADWALLLVRLVTGLVFVMHGGQKLFVYGIDGVTGSFTQMGIPMAGVAAIVVSFVEFLGGIALLAGAFTRWAAILLAMVMLVAIVQVHLPNGFFAGDNGFEFPLTLLVNNVALAIAGPGAYAVDRALAARRRAAV